MRKHYTALRANDTYLMDWLVIVLRRFIDFINRQLGAIVDQALPFRRFQSPAARRSAWDYGA